MSDDTEIKQVMDLTDPDRTRMGRLPTPTDLERLLDILHICGLNDPESLENFKEDARTIAKKLVRVAMYGAAGVDEGDENITYKLINISKASYALDVAASVMEDHLNTKKAEVTSDPVLKEVLEALAGDSEKATTKLKNFQDHFGTPS